MYTQPMPDSALPGPFGIEIVHSRSVAGEMPPQLSAAEKIEELKLLEDFDRLLVVSQAASEVSKVVEITRQDENGEQSLIDLFTAEQILEMASRIHSYLGADIDTHLETLSSPRGYPYYIGRLALHFPASDDDVTSQFGAFEARHTNPTPNAHGPKEENSREYANTANTLLLAQFKSYYQTDFDIHLVGPLKKVEGGRQSWERGIAECQFLVLDYIRDLLATGISSEIRHTETPAMTIEDIETNITNLLLQRNKIVQEVAAINPMLAEQVDLSIDTLRGFTAEVFHRGRMGALRFRKEPDNARRAIQRTEMLLIQAAGLAEGRIDQAEIPVLDI